MLYQSASHQAEKEENCPFYMFAWAETNIILAFDSSMHFASNLNWSFVSMMMEFDINEIASEFMEN